MGINCKQATELILEKEEGKLTFKQRYLLWRHLAICTLCRLFQKQNRLMNASLKHPVDAKLNSEFKHMIIESMTK